MSHVATSAIIQDKYFMATHLLSYPGIYSSRLSIIFVVRRRLCPRRLTHMHDRYAHSPATMLLSS